MPDSDRPNVVVIVADDLGWRDLGCLGSPFYETPNLDRLAREGARFTDAYASCPVCSPTRASVMSGQYPARVGVTDWIDFGGGAHPLTGRLVDAPYTDHLPEDVASLPETLDGYESWHVGKWHLGDDPNLPHQRGFDENVGGCEWGMPTNGYFGPWGIPTLDEGPEDEGRYLPDRLTDDTVELIEDHDNAEPFFLNLCYYLVHTPIEATDELVEKYEQKRRALGLDDEQETEIGERHPTEVKKDRRVKRRLVQSHPVYAAMVQSLDENVGRVLDALEREGIADETVVVFTSDNGGLATSEGSPTTNRPLAEGKGWMMEGGNRVPLIVRWPGVTDEDEMYGEPVTTPDVHATVLDAASADPPDQPLDGESLRPVFEGDGLDRDEIYWHYPHYGNQGGTPSGAVRRGDWKLVEFYEDDHVELYNLGRDVSEDGDLSDLRPDLAAELRASLSDWREEVGAVMPEENPDFEGWREDHP
jgi:arylsulfatase A-like enzyme